MDFPLAEEIRNIDMDVPLFFLTAKNMKEDILNGYRLGADDYILKPFDSEILLHKIKAIIKKIQKPAKSKTKTSNTKLASLILTAS